MVWERMPWRVAFKQERFLPSMLVGPLLFCAFKRLARRRASEQAGLSGAGECTAACVSGSWSSITISFSIRAYERKGNAGRGGPRKLLGKLRRKFEKTGDRFLTQRDHGFVLTLIRNGELTILMFSALSGIEAETEYSSCPL